MVSGIACSRLNFLPAAALLLALRQDNLHGLVNYGSLLRLPKRTFHYGFCLVKRTKLEEQKLHSSHVIKAEEFDFE